MAAVRASRRTSEGLGLTGVPFLAGGAGWGANVCRGGV
nr:MAG TPA: hypothetical protein [Caudoviricetes sp.]